MGNCSFLLRKGCCFYGTGGALSRPLPSLRNWKPPDEITQQQHWNRQMVLLSYSMCNYSCNSLPQDMMTGIISHDGPSPEAVHWEGCCLCDSCKHLLVIQNVACNRPSHSGWNQALDALNLDNKQPSFQRSNALKHAVQKKRNKQPVYENPRRF